MQVPCVQCCSYGLAALRVYVAKRAIWAIDRPSSERIYCHAHLKGVTGLFRNLGKGVAGLSRGELVGVSS